MARKTVFLVCHRSGRRTERSASFVRVRVVRRKYVRPADVDKLAETTELIPHQSSSGAHDSGARHAQLAGHPGSVAGRQMIGTARHVITKVDCIDPAVLTHLQEMNESWRETSLFAPNRGGGFEIPGRRDLCSDFSVWIRGIRKGVRAFWCVVWCAEREVSRDKESDLPRSGGGFEIPVRGSFAPIAAR